MCFLYSSSSSVHSTDVHFNTRENSANKPFSHIVFYFYSGDIHRCYCVYRHKLCVDGRRNVSDKSTHLSLAHPESVRLFALVNTLDSNSPSCRKESGGGGSRWFGADALQHWQKGVFSEGRRLVLLWLRWPLCRTAYQRSPKSQGSFGDSVPTTTTPCILIP